MEDRKLPIGIRSFEKIAENHTVYVDKTEYVYQLVHTSMPYFLSRPPRFGKSLILSTMKAYWEGKKELFSGLKIESLEKENPDAWQAYPVFFFDFDEVNVSCEGMLENLLEAYLLEWEKIYGITSHEMPLGVRFGQLLRAAAEQTGKKCVILVDEYDKPLLETMENPELVKHNKAVLNGFFSVLKSEEANIRFIFIIGGTKLIDGTFFGAIDHLRDISMSMDYAEICGFTNQEMLSVFTPEVKALAKEQGLTQETCLEKLEAECGGYHFHHKGKSIHHPYRLLSALEDRKFDACWLETGIPSSLVNRLQVMNVDVRKFTDGALYATKRMLREDCTVSSDPVPLLYRMGVLTLLEYDSKGCFYRLGFPNEEVKHGFLDRLMANPD